MPDSYPRTLAPGIVQLAPAKWRAFVEIGTGSRALRLRQTRTFTEQDFTATQRTPRGRLMRMQAWQRETETQLRTKLENRTNTLAPKRTPQTFDAAMRLYLATITARPSYVKEESHARFWSKALDQDGEPVGPQRLTDIAPSTWALIHNRWAKAGSSDSHLNKRRTFLLAVLGMYDCDHKTTLTADARALVKFRVAQYETPIELKVWEFDAILAAMPRCRAWALLWIMAETAQAPETIRRLKPTDCHEDDDQPWIHVSVRRKGKRVPGMVLHLTPMGAAAVRAYRALNAWGKPSHRTVNITWQRACAVVRAGAYPPKTAHRHRGTFTGPAHPDLIHCTPYVLRHTVACRILDLLPDPQGAQKVLQHSRGSQTERYTEARSSRAAAAAVAALAAADAAAGRGAIPHADPTLH